MAQYDQETLPLDKAIDPADPATVYTEELDRNFSLLSVCAVGAVTGNVWAALGGSIAVAISNGGPPGVLYEFIAVSFCYYFIAASIAELSSSFPTSAGVYHWASITPGTKWGRSIGFFAGFANFLAWIFGACSVSAILANQLIQMFAIYHDDYVYERWHIFVAYLCVVWLCCACVMLLNRWLPMIQNIGLFLILAGVVITIAACASLPSSHASNTFVWKDFTNLTGYSNDGLAFLLGMLNGAYAVGTPDCCTHLCEEIPRPGTNIPKAIAAQMVIGTITGLCYLIAIFYGIHDLDAVLGASGSFPLAQVYAQATGSRGGTLGLLVVIFLPSLVTCIGSFITAGRTWWTLSRDNATPFTTFFARVDRRFGSPLNATLFCGVLVTCLGTIINGSTTAFNALVGSFVILSTLSYLLAILPFLVTGRSNLPSGPFRMANPLGYIVNGFACASILFFIVIFCFPYSLPVTTDAMNYTSVVCTGLMVIVGVWWLMHRSKYGGPPTPLLEALRQAAMRDRLRRHDAK